MKIPAQELQSDSMAKLKALDAIQQVFQLITEAYPVIPGVSKVLLVRQCLQDLAIERKTGRTVVYFS